MLEHLDVDESLDVVGLEGLDDQVVGVVAVYKQLSYLHEYEFIGNLNLLGYFILIREIYPLPFTKKVLSN